ncbi:MAG: hypothetical protein JNK82_31125 [Myxococcaceae bacterium]|nr:hypothetical protein [Myxococcaceae bacterium]
MSDLLSAQVVATAGVISLALSLLGAAFTAWVCVRLPANYFCDRTRHETQLNPFLRVGKNLLGIVAFVLGLVMMIPGVPGPGVLTVLLAVVLLDFPGKYEAERWLVRRKLVHGAIDRLRERFGAPPLQRPD